MEDWDRISHCITELNQCRALAETDMLAAIDQVLKSIDNCKAKLTDNDSKSFALHELAESAENSDLTSRKRIEKVHQAISQVKVVVNRALSQHTEDEDWDDDGAKSSFVESLGIEPATSEELDLIDRALAWHFLHDGLLETARTFSKEASLNCLPEVDLVRVRSGLDAADAMLKRRDLSPAISWLEEYSSANSSNLLFDFHRLRFFQLSTSQTEAIGYAQRNFARFATTRTQEIQTLLGGLLLPSSTFGGSSAVGGGGGPVDDRAWEQARQQLLTEVRRTYGSMTPLVSAGSVAIPELQMYQNLVNPDARITSKSWKEAVELPVQVETATHFHSEFCCPVSQEQTDNTNNPPMLLVCGHVVAKNSILRIAKNRQRFKCPTCPTEQSVDAPTPINFG